MEKTTNEFHVAVKRRGIRQAWFILGAGLLALGAAGVAGYAIVVYGVGAFSGTTNAPPLANATNRMEVLRWHALFGAVALLAGTLQMIALQTGWLRRWHRKVGWSYVVAVSVSGGLGLWLAPWSEGGWMGKTGFGALAVLWLAATLKAVSAAVARDFEGHRRWMIRSFAMTCAGITLRAQLGVCLGAGYDFNVVYPWIAWACWVPNLVFAEAWLRKKSIT